MTLPWLAAVITEYLGFRRFFAADLVARQVGARTAPAQKIPVVVLVVLGLTLAGFVLISFADLSPARAAFTGAAVLAWRGLARVSAAASHR